MVVTDHDTARASISDILQQVRAKSLRIIASLNNIILVDSIGACLRCLDDDQVVHPRPPGFHFPSEPLELGVGSAMDADSELTGSPKLYARPSDDGMEWSRRSER